MNHERYTGPKQPQPTWEQLLVGVLERKVMPEDDPKRPTEGLNNCSRWFQTGSGEDVKLLAFDLSEPDNTWFIGFYEAGTDNKKYGFTIESQQPGDEKHLYAEGSDMPLDQSIAEDLLGRIATSQPIRDTYYEVCPTR